VREYSRGCSTVPKLPFFLSIYIDLWFTFHVQCCSDEKSCHFFIGTGEHMDEFEVFDVKPFVCRLLGILAFVLMLF